MSNISTIDDMPDITSNFTDDVYEHHESLYERIFLEVFTIVGLGSIIANSLLIFVILKYKKMREDATNKIFLHVNILQAIYLFATPLTLRMALLFFYTSPVHVIVFCVSYQIEFSVIFVIILFLFLLVCDWYVKLYHKEKYETFCRVNKFVIIALYILFVCISSVTTQACFRLMMVFIAYLAMMACVALGTFCLIVVNIVHVFKKRKLLSFPKKGNIGLAIANIFLLCWLPLIFLILIMFTGLYVNAPVLVIVLFSLGFSSPMFNLLYLYIYDDNYNVFLRQVFRCRCNDYKNDNLDDQPVTYNDANGVKITVN